MSKPKGYYEWTQGDGGCWKRGGIYWYDGSSIETDGGGSSRSTVEEPSWRYLGPEKPQEKKELFVYICWDCKECPPCYLVMEEEPKLCLDACPFKGIASATWSRYYGRQ